MGKPGFSTPLLWWAGLLALTVSVAACGGAQGGPGQIGARPTPGAATARPALAPPTATPLVLASLGGEQPATEAAGPEAAAGGKLTLRVGEEGRVGADGPGVRFVRVVEDSRCPANARCIWQGRVVVELSVTSDGATTPLTLGTLEGFADAPATAEVGGLTLSIAGVEPYPDTSGPIPEDQYVLTLALS